MVTAHSYGKTTWVDVFDPSADEVRELMETYDIDPALAEKLHYPMHDPRVHRYKDAILFVLQFPVFKHSHAQSTFQEIDCLITKKAFITVRYDEIDSVHKFAKLLEVSGELEENLPKHPTGLSIALLSRLYRGVEHELRYIRDQLNDVEKNIFSGEEKKMVHEISVLGRELLHFQESLTDHIPVVYELSDAFKDVFGKKYTEEPNIVLQYHEQAQREASHCSDILSTLRNTNDSLLYAKQNEVMKMFTVMAFMIFPLTLITNIFSLPTQTLPIIGHPNDFWIIVGSMAILAVLFFAFFLYKRWL